MAEKNYSIQLPLLINENNANTEKIFDINHIATILVGMMLEKLGGSCSFSYEEVSIFLLNNNSINVRHVDEHIEIDLQ